MPLRFMIITIEGLCDPGWVGLENKLIGVVGGTWICYSKSVVASLVSLTDHN